MSDRRIRTSGFLEPVDLVFDTVGGATLEASPAVIRPGGRLVSVAEEAQEVAPEAKIETSYFVVEPNREQLVELTRLAEAGDLVPAIDSVFPLADARSAFERARPAASVARWCSASARTVAMSDQRAKGEAFRALHAGEPFVIPTPGTPARQG